MLVPPPSGDLFLETLTPFILNRWPSSCATTIFYPFCFKWLCAAIILRPFLFAVTLRVLDCLPETPGRYGRARRGLPEISGCYDTAAAMAVMSYLQRLARCVPASCCCSWNSTTAPAVAATASHVGKYTRSSIQRCSLSTVIS